MKITKAESMLGCFLVHVDAGDLQCDAKSLPYPTCIGVVYPRWFKPTGRVEVWTPAAYKPRGYKRAARAMLESALTEIRSNGVDTRYPKSYPET